MGILYDYGFNNQFVSEAGLYTDFIPARVLSQHKGSYKIITNSGEMKAKVSGKFRFETSELVKFPTVGDFVMVSAENINTNDYAIIHHILTRKSIFLRTAVGLKEQAQGIVANVDTVFICMSLNNNFNLSRLERYLSVAWDSGSIPVIVLTKSDLCDNIDEIILKVECISSFADIITISVFDNDTIEKFSKYIGSCKTVAFIGSSGVGKSTLINKLLGEDILATSDIGKADKGRHTTTGKEMFISPFGGILVDTPGMRELGAESINLDKTFDDIEELAKNCKFSNCTHTNEPNCAILSALEDGTLDNRRFENYCKLKTEVGYGGLTSKEIEVKKLERMFKDVGGMKNMRKFVKEHKKRN